MNEKSIMFRIIVAIVVAGVLAGCAPGSERADSPSTSGISLSKDIQAKVKALERAGKNVVYIYEVPETGEYIANGLLALTTKLGVTSTASSYLTEILKASRLPSITVVGASDLITASVIESAIKNLRGAKTSTVIYFAGNHDYVENLRAVAAQAGVPLEAVPYK